jgi:hypothetical protein
MSYSNPLDEKRNSHKQYLKNKSKVNKRARIRLAEVRKRNHAEMMKYLSVHPCVVCGESDPIVLEFNHIDPKTKKNSIAQLVSSNRWEKVLEEIEKCEVLCANDHKRVTAKQKRWSRAIGVL